MQRFFQESVGPRGNSGMRAMLVTNYPEQVPRSLPADIKVFGYLPFSQVLPRAALLVYHGGVGTLAQGIKARVPHLVVPHGYDQFDSGWRIEQLGLGGSIPQTRYRAPRVAANDRAHSGRDGAAAQRRREYASRIDAADAVAAGLRIDRRIGPARQAGQEKTAWILRPTPLGYRTSGGVGWFAGARFS